MFHKRERKNLFYRPSLIVLFVFTVVLVASSCSTGLEGKEELGASESSMEKSPTRERTKKEWARQRETNQDNDSSSSKEQSQEERQDSFDGTNQYDEGKQDTAPNHIDNNPPTDTNKHSKEADQPKEEDQPKENNRQRDRKRQDQAPQPKLLFDVKDKAPFRIGFNFIREKSNTKYKNSSAVLGDIKEVGGQGTRQYQGFGVSWFNTMTCKDYQQSSCYDFSKPDSYFVNQSDIYPLPTLFQLGNANGAKEISGDQAADCEQDAHKKKDYCRYPVTPTGEHLGNISKSNVKSMVEAYVKKAVEHYAKYGIRHWEVLNEPENFIYRMGISEIGYYSYYFTPEHYVKLLEVTKKAALSKDKNAKIVMAGLFYEKIESGKEKKWQDWFDKILDKGAAKHMDIANFHFYGKWKALKGFIDEVKSIMNKHKAKLPIWMTEVGSSAVQTSQDEQAKDVFKYFAVAFGNGVELANWHTHISRHDQKKDYGGYGTISSRGKKYKSWYSYQLFAKKFGNFGSCSAVRQGANDIWIYKCSGALYTNKGSMPTRYIAWSSNGSKTTSFDFSSEFPQNWNKIRVTQTVQQNNKFQENTQQASQKVSLSNTPVIIEESK